MAPRHARRRRARRRRRATVAAAAVLLAAAIGLVAAVSASGGGAPNPRRTAEPVAGSRGALPTEQVANRAAPTTAVTTSTTAPPPPIGATNPPAPTPRPDTGNRPTVAYFGDSMSVNAAPVIKEQLAAAGYDLVLFNAFIGDSMCKVEDQINETIVDLKPRVLVLQMEGNASIWGCVDGYQATYELYDRAVGGIGLNAAFNGAPGGTKVLLVAPLPHADGQPLYPGSPAVADVFRSKVAAQPGTFAFVDPSPGLVPGPGALVPCYPQEPGCRLDGLIQVRTDDHNPITGLTTAGGGPHFCTDPTFVNLAEEDCNVPNAGGLRFAYNVVNGLRATGW